MILDFANKYSIDLLNSFMIGDRSSDINAGVFSRVQKLFFIDRNYSEKKPIEQDFTVKSLMQAVKTIEKNLQYLIWYLKKSKYSLMVLT